MRKCIHCKVIRITVVRIWRNEWRNKRRKNVPSLVLVLLLRRCRAILISLSACKRRINVCKSASSFNHFQNIDYIQSAISLNWNRSKCISVNQLVKYRDDYVDRCLPRTVWNRHSLEIAKFQTLCLYMILSVTTSIMLQLEFTRLHHNTRY